MIQENPPSEIADKAMRDRSEMIAMCARRVLSELESGRNVDPHRIAWARAALAINMREAEAA